MKKKKAFTLLEIIIVIFLITLITGAIGYNMKGTLDKGRAFRTEQAIEQLQDLFLLCHAEGESPKEIKDNPVGMLNKYKLAKDPQKLVKDGWGIPMKITYAASTNEFQIVSKKLELYRSNTKVTHSKDPLEDELASDEEIPGVSATN